MVRDGPAPAPAAFEMLSETLNEIKDCRPSFSPAGSQITGHSCFKN